MAVYPTNLKGSVRRYNAITAGFGREQTSALAQRGPRADSLSSFQDSPHWSVPLCHGKHRERIRHFPYWAQGPTINRKAL